MRGLLYRVWLFFSAVLLSACAPAALHDEQGQSVDLTKHPGKWLVVNYWAPWCAACKQELPEINQFYLTHRDQVLVYGFNYDHPNRAILLQMRKQMGIDFPLLVEDPQNQLALPQNVQALPTTFIYNPAGQLVSVLRGPQTVKQLIATTTG